MQGFPLLRLLLVGAALALLGIPVWMLTRERPTAAAPPPQIILEKTGTFHVVLTTSTPAVLRMMAANQPTATSGQPVMRFETDFKMNASEPEDIALFADFTDKTHPHAVRAEVSIGEKILTDSTFWGTGLVEDVVEIPSP
jgi:hypothetical protein